MPVKYFFVLKIIPTSLACLFVFFQIKDDMVYFGIVIALIFCLLGDIGIDYNFLIGMVFFSVAQLSFTITYLLLSFSIGFEQNVIIIVLIIGILMAGYFFYIIRYLENSEKGLGNFKIPVIFYGMFISFMLVTAFLLWLASNDINYITIVIGGLFFVLSDSIIAVREFHHRLSYSTIKIMSTYYIALLFISMIPII
ncbi:MAG: lysoplasmalogenase family protein [Candidatus Hodarchaeales archaeon]